MPFSLSQVRALLIDMDGVVYYNDGPLDGVNEFLALLRENGIAHAFATNGTRNRPEDHRRRLAQYGIDVRDTLVFTAGMATADYLWRTAQGARVYVIGGDGFRRELEERAGCQIDDEAPDFVVVGFTETFDYGQLETACRAIHRGARLVIGDPDVNDPHPDGPTPGSGAFAAAIEAATGCVGYRVGKPGILLYEMALRGLGAQAAQAAIVGDRLDSDIAGGIAAGMGTILVLTGISTLDSVERSEIKPDLVVDDLVELRLQWSHALSVRPPPRSPTGGSAC